MIDVVTDGEIIPAKVVYVRNSLSYDAMTAHTAVVFTRYMILSLESRESNDNRSLGELFLYFSDEKINELVDTFMNTLPTMLKTQLQAA